METIWGVLPAGIIYLFTAIFGLCVGSFANVLIYRLPREESIVRPASRCPSCGRSIRPLENIPVVSWIALGGRCRGCEAPISVRYPLVEAAGGGLMIISVAVHGPGYAGLAYGLLYIALLALTIIDIEHWLLPFGITVPLAFIGLLGAAFFGLRPLADSLLGMVVGFSTFMILLAGGKALFKKDAMGGGDVAFGVMAGAFLGWKLTILMAFVASFLGVVAALPLVLLGRGVAGRMMPFGPFLAAALVVCLLWGDRLVEGYMRLVGF